MGSEARGLKSALRPLGAALLGAGIALAATGAQPVVGGVLAVVGAVLVFVGGDAAAPLPPAPPPPPALPPIPQPGNGVAAASAFGAAAQAGSSADYARADHSHGTPALPPSPELPLPASTAPGAVEFGQPAAVGTSTAYARADHRHAAPALPAAGGDVQGPLDALRVTSLQGAPLAAATPAADEVLGFDGTRWVARALPAPPPPPPAVTLPSPGGDLVGTVSQARVAALQGVRLDADSPAAGQVLSFDGSRWRPADLPAPPPAPAPVVVAPPPAATPAGDFVARSDKAFRVVAAGEVELRLHNATAQVATGTAYGGLRGVSAMRGAGGGSLNEYLVVVQAADGPNTTQDAYAVQLTPVRATGSSVAFGVGLQGAVINDGHGAIRFTAVVSAAAPVVDGAHNLRMTVLVSRFGV